ncbi:unnamed protein product [Fusarium equiseti]|uniref:Uncharacterized protein n=1 Tax=Fusarium equiseti TaxID=61235 RepID=A0A8J2IV69_FUSEQ|nr:unnamed protein product [Fusarium equiseti]
MLANTFQYGLLVVVEIDSLTSDSRQPDLLEGVLPRFINLGYDDLVSSKHHSNDSSILIKNGRANVAFVKQTFFRSIAGRPRGGAIELQGRINQTTSRIQEAKGDMARKCTSFDQGKLVFSKLFAASGYTHGSSDIPRPVSALIEVDEARQGSNIVPSGQVRVQCYQDGAAYPTLTFDQSAGSVQFIRPTSVTATHES